MSKDQPIYKAHEPTPDWATRPAQPDCRTCTRYIYEGCGSKTICINADQYIEAPALVLWRTE